MSAGGPEPGMFAPRPEEQEPRSTLPWVIAGGVVLIVLGLIVAFGHRNTPSNPGGAGLAPADPYAVNLPITGVKMSQAGSMVGGQTTYIDGQITNKGTKTVTGITVQVAFHGYAEPIAQKSTMLLNLIRTREPYVDTEPVSAAPILPGQTRDFRLIFDSVPRDWDQSYPEIRVIQVTSK